MKVRRPYKRLTDTGENVQNASVKSEENNVSTFGGFRLWTSFEISPVSVKIGALKYLILKLKGYV